MIPLRDENPTRRTPWVTYLIVAVNIAVFALEATRTDAQLVALLNRWGARPDLLASNPLDLDSWNRAVTSMFLHAGWLHLIGNMLYLWIFGNNVEDRFGHLRFVIFYVACGLAAVGAQVAASPDSTVPLIGASGAIAGVLGAYVVLYPGARVLTLIPIFFFFELAVVPALFVIGFWFVLQLLQGLGSLGQDVAGGVAWWAHVGGFVLGMLLALPAGLNDRRTRRARFRTWV